MGVQIFMETSGHERYQIKKPQNQFHKHILMPAQTLRLELEMTLILGTTKAPAFGNQQYSIQTKKMANDVQLRRHTYHPMLRIGET